MGRGYLGWILERGISTVSPPWSNFYNIEKVQVKKNRKSEIHFLLSSTNHKAPLEFLLLCLHFYPIIRDCFRLFFALFTVNLWRIFFLAFKTFFIIFILKFWLKWVQISICKLWTVQKLWTIIYIFGPS